MKLMHHQWFAFLHCNHTIYESNAERQHFGAKCHLFGIINIFAMKILCVHLLPHVLKLCWTSNIGTGTSHDIWSAWFDDIYHLQSIFIPQNGPMGSLWGTCRDGISALHSKPFPRICICWEQMGINSSHSHISFHTIFAQQVHTQRIESHWHNIKRTLPASGR